jgi:spermidine synthase
MQVPRLNVNFTYSIGILYGILYAIGNYRHQGVLFDLHSPHVIEGLLLAALVPLALRFYQHFFHARFILPQANPELTRSFYRLEMLAYLVLLLPSEMLTGIRGGLALTLLLFSVVALIQALLYLSLLDGKKRAALMASEQYIAVLFLISGFSALIYQVVWQRVLFTTFGINTEAVTVIVSVFMFGLGVGALAGGFLQKKFPNYLLPIFVGLEVLIGVFGIFSLDLIHYISSVSPNTSTLQLVGWTYVILALPTLLMGATLPILVSFLQKYFNNLGKTVGLLYAFNTFGSAIAAFCTVEVLFVLLGQSASVMIAAACNLSTALLIIDASRRLRAAPTAPVAAANDDGKVTLPALPGLPYLFVFGSLMAIGYISLSQEIIWYRLLGFLTGGRPQVFGLLLAAFLVGIALGALKSKRICEQGTEPYGYVIKALIKATMIFYLAVPLVAYATALLGKDAGPVIGYLLIGALAYYTGGMLPMLIHIGVGQHSGSSSGGGKNAAMSMSWLYFANIIGATCGPMLTGFILLDHFSMVGNVVILSLLTLLLLFAVLFVIPKEFVYKLRVTGVVAALSLLAFLAHDRLFAGHLEMLQYATFDRQPFKHAIENRAGIITVQAGKDGMGDIIYGGGIYDGRFNVDPVINSNLIDRAYMIAALHRKPQTMLEIGLSSGSWTSVLDAYQPLQRMSVVEINAGYRHLIDSYPDIARGVRSPKHTLFIDDGRRWLRNHPDEKFDLIVMNTTYYWRSNSSNLLSKQFLTLAKQHLNPNGVIYYNTTGSDDVVYTAAQVFRHIVKVRNFVAASDAPFDMTPAEKHENLLQFTQADGTPLFSKDADHLKLLDQLANHRLIDVRQAMVKEKNLHLITDDNMAVEYKLKVEVGVGKK